MKTIVILAATLAVTGCAVQKELVPTGGSRSDGTVELSYDFGMFEKPEVDYVGGRSAAAQRCRAWGYTDAEPFGGGKTHCEAWNGYGNCIHTSVTIQYQCTGAAKPQ